MFYGPQSVSKIKIKSSAVPPELLSDVAAQTIAILFDFETCFAGLLKHGTGAETRYRPTPEESSLRVVCLFVMLGVKADWYVMAVRTVGKGLEVISLLNTPMQGDRTALIILRCAWVPAVYLIFNSGIT